MKLRKSATDVDLTAKVGKVVFANPVMTASGTAGHGAELGAYFDLSTIGAVVVKSLSAKPWQGNPAPRLHPVSAGMLNSVGLQNPGVDAWREHELPALHARGATVVASIWGFTVEDYKMAADALAACGPEVVAVEVNLSCPNTEAGRQMFAHDQARAAAAIAATAGCGRPRWAKLSPNVTDIVPIAGAVLEAGADAVTLVNTVMGLALDPATGRARLGNGGGGLSGAAIRPVAVRAVYEVRAAFPSAGIIGVGGVTSGDTAAELLAAGANAIQVGTATFADPRAPSRVLHELRAWCARHRVSHIDELIGKAHR
ncbi:MAG: dihydroorotate dehydrogenase catalytic subunit [Actinomycetota bacterium]|jgi:dihydroorotate dehydrogenase (NAD+) catalytic subunit